MSLRQPRCGRCGAKVELGPVVKHEGCENQSLSCPKCFWTGELSTNTALRKVTKRQQQVAAVAAQGSLGA